MVGVRDSQCSAVPLVTLPSSLFFSSPSRLTLQFSWLFSIRPSPCYVFVFQSQSRYSPAAKCRDRLRTFSPSLSANRSCFGGVSVVRERTGIRIPVLTHAIRYAPRVCVSLALQWVIRITNLTSSPPVSVSRVRPARVLFFFHVFVSHPSPRLHPPIFSIFACFLAGKILGVVDLGAH